MARGNAASRRKKRWESSTIFPRCRRPSCTSPSSGFASSTTCRRLSFSTLARHLTEHLDDVASFTLHLGAPTLQETAIEVTATPLSGWDALVAAAREGIRTTFPGDDSLPPPHAPHLSLAYATGPAPDEVVRQRLGGC